MLKKILIYIAAALAATYILLALLFLTGKEQGELCKGVDIEINDAGYNVLSTADVRKIMGEKGLELKGKPLDGISCSKVEKILSTLPIVDDCQCYKTHKGFVGITIDCKIPIMQAFDINGREFFIDRKGTVIEGMHNAVYLPVASGFITRDMARKELLALATFLHDNRFWNEQIEQIYFTAKKEIILVPRVGNHTVEFGKAEKIEEKFGKLLKFYEKGLNTIGWNKYKKINVEFDKQVICTKRD